jgi:sterol desaturase/sphingolipid hydroxylase (fatty acid hydroxylase superfamily)
MNNWIDAHAVLIRLVSVVTAFVAMAIAEVLLEARPQRVARRTRWLHNLGLTLLNTVVLRILFPVGAVSAALWSANDGFGVLNLVEWPTFAEIVVALAILDLAIYGQHVLFHAVPLLFRFHRVHHADVDFDVTLGARFHPIELLLSMSINWR